MNRIPLILGLGVLSCTFATTRTDAQELPLPVETPQRSEPVDFAKEIAPILKKNCLACHHQKEAEGGLVLESIASIKQGGDSGNGVVPRDLENSVVFTRASGTEEPLMPPEDNAVGAKPLTPTELGLLKLWIEQGATGQDTAATASIQWQPIPESIRTVYALDVSPDGQLAAIGHGNRVTVIDLLSYAERARLTDPGLSGGVADVDFIQSIAFAPDALRIATGGFRTVRIWKKIPAPVDPSVASLTAAAGLIAVNSDATRAGLVNAIGDIEVWDLQAGQKLHTLTGHEDRISGLVWAGGTDFLFSCDATGQIIVWSTASGDRIVDFASQAALTKLAVSADAKNLAAIDATGKVFAFLFQDNAITSSGSAIGEITDATAIAVVAQPPVLVVASDSKGVVMMNAEDHKPLRTLDHGAACDALAVTGDQSRLITGGRDGKTRIWNIADGKPGLVMEGDSADQLRIAVANRDAGRQKGTVDRLTNKTGQLEKLLAAEAETLKKATEEKKKASDSLTAEEKKQQDAIDAVAATKDKITLAEKDQTKAKEMLEAANKLLAESNSAGQKVADEIDRQKEQLAAAQRAVEQAQQQLIAFTKAKDEALQLTAQIQQIIQEKNQLVEKAAADAKQAQQQVEAANKMAADAKAAAEQSAKALEPQEKAVQTAADSVAKAKAEVSKRQQAFVAAQGAHRRAEQAIPDHVTVLEAATRKKNLLDRRLERTRWLATLSGNQVVAVTTGSDDSTIATAHRDGSVRLYRTVDGSPLTLFPPAQVTARSGLEQTSVAIVGNSVIQFGADARPSIWSADYGWELERTIGSIEDPAVISDRVTALQFRRDGKTIAVGSGPPSRSGEVKVFAVDSGSIVRDFGEVHSDTVLGLAFSPDGRKLASSAADKTIRLLDLASGELVRSFEGHTHHVLGVAWQDDGQTIASVSADQTVKIWNVETGQQRRTIGGFSKETTAVSFVDTTNQIVTACADGQLRLSDTSNGKALRTFNAAGEFLFTLSVTPDGKKLLAGGQSGAVRIWTVADGKQIKVIE